MVEVSKDFTGVLNEFFAEEPTLVKKETPYRDGKINGVEKEYQLDEYLRSIDERLLYEEEKDVRNLIRQTPYVDGLKHGVEIIDSPLGNEHTETPYVQGKREGVEKYINYDEIIETEFHNDKENGIRKIYTDLGYSLKTVMFVNGQKQGAEVSSFGEDLLKLTHYTDNKKKGAEIEWNFDGFKTWLNSIKNFADDKQEGKTYLFENGNVVQVDEYVRGELVSSKNDHVTLAKARLIEIPNILTQAEVNQHKEDLMNKENLDEEEKQIRRDAWKMSRLSGTVINDKAIQTGVHIETPHDSEYLAVAIAHKKYQKD